MTSCQNNAETGGKCEISVVAPCYNEEETIGEFVRRTNKVLRESTRSYEIILVDDGSHDRTLPASLALLQEYPNLKVASLSRNFGHQAAVTAGLDLAEGSAVVLIDSDLQDPPEVIPEMIAKWKEGYEIVYGQRRAREGETHFKLFTARLFYRLLRRLTNVNMPLDAGDFRLMDRCAVNALTRLREHHRYIRGMTSWIGFKQAPVSYDRKSRFAGTTKYPLRKMLLFSLDAITSFSVVPLRVLLVSGILLMLGSILLGILIVLVKWLMPTFFIPGFPFLILLIAFFGGLNMFSLGLIGEYMGRIFEEVKNRPLYLLRGVYTVQQPQGYLPPMHP